MQTQSDNSTGNNIEKISEFLSVEFLHNGKLVIFTVTSIHPSVITSWANKVKEVMTVFPAGKVYYNLHDYTQANSFVTTPFLRQKSKENALLRPDLSAFTAICIPPSVLSHITRLFVQALPRHRDAKRERRIFFSRQEGLNWIEDQMRQNGDL
jgi:hypothetical protein